MAGKKIKETVTKRPVQQALLRVTCQGFVSNRGGEGQNITITAAQTRQRRESVRVKYERFSFCVSMEIFMRAENRNMKHILDNAVLMRL